MVELLLMVVLLFIVMFFTVESVVNEDEPKRKPYQKLTILIQKTKQKRNKNA
jgi:hypothetical protein